MSHFSNSSVVSVLHNDIRSTLNNLQKTNTSNSLLNSHTKYRKPIKLACLRHQKHSKQNKKSRRKNSTSLSSMPYLPSSPRQYKLPFPLIPSSRPKNTYNTPSHPYDKPLVVQTIPVNSNTSDDIWFGDQLCLPAKQEIRFWVHNTNGINIGNNFSHYMEQLDHMKRFNIDFLSLTETKLNSYNGYVSDNIEAAHSWIYPEGKVLMANSYIGRSDIRQYGGVLASVQGVLSGRFSKYGKDKYGRFCWMEFFGKKKHFKVYTLYRTCTGSDTSSGDETAWMTQRAALLEDNISIDPREHVIISLLQCISDDIAHGTSILLCGDVNEDVFSNCGISHRLHQVGMVNVFKDLYGFQSSLRSCTKGSTVIDGIWVSLDLDQFVVRRGLAPFNFLFPSDHRGLYCDLDLSSILDDQHHHMTPAPYRRLKSNIPRRVNKYTDVVFSKWKNHKISDKVSQILNLLENQGPSSHVILALNKLDDEIQNILSSAEKSCCNIGRHCVHNWSKDLEKSLRNMRQIKGCLLNANRLNDGRVQTEKIKSLMKQYNDARRQVRFCKKHSISLREAMYDQLATDLLKEDPKRYKNKASVIRQIKNCERMKRDALKIKHAVKDKSMYGISYVLIPAKSNYSDDVRLDQSFNHYDITTIWNRLQLHNGKDIREWERVDDRDQMETYIIEFLQQHFAQASSTPLANTYWLNRLSDPNFQQHILSGEFSCDTSLPEETNDILRSFYSPCQTELPFLPSLDDFKLFILKSSEKTSASPSSRHYGHYKALLRKTPHILSDIFSLLRASLQYGIVMNRWKKTVTALLCKDDNKPYIHRLRPIHIVEVELQFVAKILWGKQLITSCEDRKLLTPSQYGGRKFRQAQSSVLNTTLSFDYHRQLRKNFTYNDDDLRANFDRELAHFSSLESRKFGLSHQAGAYMTQVTKQQQYFVKTTYGTSLKYYQFTNDRPIWGLGQGICWAGACWQLTATTIATHLMRKGCGAKISNPEGTCHTDEIIEFFIDDTKKICNYTSDNRSLLHQSQYNMQLHTNLVLSTGGLLALDKCKFYLIEFAFTSKGDPYIKPISQSPGRMMISNGFTSDQVEIKRMEPSEVHRTLGYYLSPTGDYTHQLSILVEMAKQWATRVSLSTLSSYNKIQAYRSILLPQIQYRLASISLTYEQCDRLNVITNPILLHAYGIQKHFSRAILEAGDQYAGLQLHHFYDIHGITKFKFLKHHLYHNDRTGKLLLISMQYTQLELGLGQPFYNTDYDKFSFLVTPTWVTHLWQYFSARCLRLTLNLNIVLPFQRENDDFIMRVIQPFFSTDDLCSINKMRISLQLLFLSDVCDMRGRYLLPDLRKGLTYRTSKLQWPTQPWIKSWNPLWRQTCSVLQKYISTNPLGDWKCQHFTWDATLSIDNKFIRYKSRLFSQFRPLSKKYVPSPVQSIEQPTPLYFVQQADIYVSRGNPILVSSTPLSPSRNDLIVPYSYDMSRDTQLFGSFSRPNELEIVDTIKNNNAKMCTDASVSENGLASFAYCLAGTGDNILMQQHAPVHGSEHISSTRAELMGILACLKYLHYLSSKYDFCKQRHPILIICDNIQATRAHLTCVSSIKTTLMPDGDIIREIKYWVRVSTFRLNFKHIHGHLDDNQTYESLSPLAQLNVKMDALAKEFFTAPTNAPERLPDAPFLPNDCASLSSPYGRITSNFTEEILKQYIGANAELQFTKTFQITSKKLKLIDWSAINSFFHTCKGYNRYKHIKCFHKQWATMHRNWRWKESPTPICPLCSIRSETCDHVLQCTCNHVCEFRQTALTTLKKSLIELQTRPLLVNHIMRMIYQWTGCFPQNALNPDDFHDTDKEVAHAINDQLSLGTSNLLRGILAYRLVECQLQYYRDLPQKRHGSGTSWNKKILSHLLTYSISLWNYRCEQVQQEKSLTAEGRTRAECSDLFLKLRSDKTQLPASFRYLLEKDLKFFHVSSIQAITSWLRRVRIGVKKQETISRNNCDIRTWTVKKVSSIPMINDDVSINSVDSDATALWYEKYPDEHPDLNTWYTTTSCDSNLSSSPKNLLTPYIQFQNLTAPD